MMDVSVVVPTHNRRELVAQAIDSILRQRGVAIEVIVVDDGSTDGTGAWLAGIKARDSRVKVIDHAQPRFISAARNAGIACASARWVAFCDDDDLWAPDKLATQLSALQRSSARWGCAGTVVIDQNLEIVGHQHVASEMAARILENNGIPTSSTIAERRLLREVGGFDRGLRGSEDWDMWIRLAQHSPLMAVDRPLIAYRLGRQSLSMDVDRMRGGHAVVVKRYAELAAAAGVAAEEATHERYLAKQLLRAGSRRGAAAIFASLALKHGRWRELPRVAAALMAPRLTDQLGQRRARAAVPPAWRCDAEAWLAPIRDASRTGRRDPYAWVEAEALGV